MTVHVHGPYGPFPKPTRASSGSQTPPRLSEPVADGAHGLDEVRVLLAELRPQPPDVDVDGAGPAVVLVAPHPGQERLAREDLAGVGGEELQQLVLHVGQVERASIARRLVGLEVEHELAVLDELGPRPPAGAPEQVLQPRLELAGLERAEAEVV